MRFAWVLTASLLLGHAHAADVDAPVRVEAGERDAWWRPLTSFKPMYLPAAAISLLEGCYVVEYTINDTGKVDDAVIVRSRTRFAKRASASAGNAGQRVAIGKAQADAVLESVRAMRFQAGIDNPSARPIRTATVPIVFTMQNFENPQNAAAVEREQRRQEQSSREWTAKCAEEGLGEL